MILAGGVLVAGCGGGERLGSGGTGGQASTGGNTGTGGLGVPCGNASSDPCICGRPMQSSAAAEACAELTACEGAAGTWIPGKGQWGAGGTCQGDGGVVIDLDGGSDGGAHD